MTACQATVVLVCYNEQKNISDCLNALCNQDMVDPYQILVVDGGSTDRTLDIVREFVRSFPFVRLLDNPCRFISHARNIGWQSAVTPLIVYTDADCVVPLQWLNRLIEAYHRHKCSHPELVAVGSGNRPPSEGDFYQSLAIVLGSFFGNRGSVQGKLFAENRWVAHIPTLNILYERCALARVGGFDENMGSIGEDEDLNCRLAKLGGRILYIPEATLIHKQRSTWRSWCRNMRVYGYGRIQLMKKHRELRKGRDFLPLILVGVFLLLGFMPVSPLFGVPAFLYILFFIVYSIILTFRRELYDLRVAARVFSIFIGTHIAYGWGMGDAIWLVFKRKWGPC